MTEYDGGPVGLVRSALVSAGVGDTVRTFATGVPTAAAAAEALECDLAAITNSLVFDLGGEPLLIVAGQLGSGTIRRASPAFVLEHTGQEVGGVAPIGHPKRITTLLDESLQVHRLLWAGAGDHNSMFSITYQDLLRITGARELTVR